MNFELLRSWADVKEQIKQYTELLIIERELRKQVFDDLFPSPKEGVTSIPLENGWKLKAVYRIGRKVDKPAWEKILPNLASADLNPNSIVKYTPELLVPAYKRLTKEQKNLVDAAIIAKPDAPTLGLVAPKDA